MDPCAALFLGPHPDDVEIAAGGTILRLTAAGHRVAIVDVTRGEMGSRGTPEQRTEEAERAAALLGVTDRSNLGMPDCGVAEDDRTVRTLVGLLRQSRPRVLFAPVDHDVHPDHRAVARLAQRAFFTSGLVRYAPDLGAPFRPRLLVGYPGNLPVDPSFVVDVTAQRDKKAEVLACYRSQQLPADDRAHLVQGRDVVERAAVRDAYFGMRIGVMAGEPFVVDGPLPVSDPTILLSV